MSYGKTLISELQQEGVQFNHSVPQGRTPIGNIRETGPPPPMPSMSRHQPQPVRQQPQPVRQQPQPHLMNLNDPEEPIPIEIELEEEEISEKSNPTIDLFGLKLDLDSTIVISLGIFVWIYVWYSTGLYVKVQQNFAYLLIFSSFILYSLLNIVTSGSKSGGAVFELNILLTVEQMISILFGTIVVFTIFYERLPVHPETGRLIHRVSIAMLILLSLASMWLNVITSGRSFRAIRKAKQALYNIALALFITIGVLVSKSSTPMSEIITFKR